MTEKDKLYADELRNRALSDYERLDLAINELEQQPCEDCISRAEAEAIFKNARKSLYELSRKEQVKDFQTREMMLLNAEQFIHLLPSVTPSYNSIKTELKPCEDVLDDIITQIEQVRDKDRIAEYPYNRCIRIVEEYKNEYIAESEEV